MVIRLFFIIITLLNALSCNAEIKITSVEKWCNVFSGSVVAFRFSMSADESFHGRTIWQFTSSGGIITRGERQLEIEQNDRESFEISIQIPEIKEGIILQSLLTVSVIQNNVSVPLASINKNIWVFHKDPFKNRKQFINDLNIHLYDPVKRTSNVFKKNNIPYKEIFNPDSISTIRKGLIIIGEDVSFRRHKGLPKLMLEAAANGISVLCLASADGELAIPGIGNNFLLYPDTLNFNQPHIIKLLDKRFDFNSWPPDNRIVKSTLKISEDKSHIISAKKSKEGGWPWMEVNYRNKTSCLIFCGFGIIEKWEDTPTPRYLLMSILEHVTRN